MTPEQKLNHLRDWIGCWISCKISNDTALDDFFWLWTEAGIIWMPRHKINVIPFDEYIQLIEQKKSLP